MLQCSNSRIEEIRAERGPGALTYCWGPETYFDATNPDARRFVWEKVRENYYRYGIRNFWLDEAEPEILPYDYDNLRYDLGNGMEVSCLYPFFYAKGFYDGLKEAGEEEVLNLIRCAFLGSQRFGVTLWSGDVGTDFAALRRQLKTALNVAMSGIPWWSTDIGGFRGGNPEDPAYRECIIRWFQFGAFCPVFRLHGNRFRPNKPKIPHFYTDPFCPAGGPNEIWSYGEDAYDLFDQYLFGDDLMVCPVYEKDARERSVLLPAGCRWTEVLTGKVYEGGRRITAAAPLAHIPLFLREGSPLDIRRLRGDD